MKKRARNIADDELVIEDMVDRGRKLFGDVGFKHSTIKFKQKKIFPLPMYGIGRVNQFGWVRTFLLMIF